MRRFAETCEAVAATTKKHEKVRLVSEYLKSLPIDAAALAAVFFTGLAFPRKQERVLAVGGSLVWQVVSKISGASAEDMSAAYRRYGDAGAAVADVFGGKESADALTLADVERAFEGLAARRGPSQKIPVLEELLSRAGALEAKYIVKIITGDMRIGLRESLVEEAVAKAYAQPLEKVQRANMLEGDIAEALRLAAAGRLEQARFRLLHAVGFMLASPTETAEEAMEYFPNGALVEDKYDGIRAQAHKSGSQVKLFSRTLDEIVEFPELAPALAAIPGEFILDGEVLAWRDGRALPFTDLQKRLGRKTPSLFITESVPVAFMAFDILYAGGEVLLEQPLNVRRERLARLVTAPSNSVQLSPIAPCNSVEDLRRTFEAAFARGNEGVMVKAPDSTYTPGRRGRAWLKLKRPMATLDVVVTAVEYGHGKRHKVLSDYTFSVRVDGADELVTIGKAYSGLTHAEIAQRTEFFKQHIVEDEGWRLKVEPLVVIEVAFNNIQKSSRHESGYALRFPRILRLRPDKPVSEIDTLERVKQLYELQQTAGAAR